MRKILSLALAFAIVICMALTLVSCSKMLYGTYSAGGEWAGKSYKFSGSSVEIKYMLFGFEKTAKATYEIKEVEDEDDDKDYVITITLNEGEDDNGQNLAGTFPFSEGKDEDGDYIWIGIIKYYKQ